jgi:uncharacterized small protein (DUF1192 family)
MVDGEKRDTKFDCRLKGEKQTVLKKNAELAERIAKLATRLAELEAAAQKKPSS